MIEIGPGVELGLGVTIGDVTFVGTRFITEITEFTLVSETDDTFIEEQE